MECTTKEKIYLISILMIYILLGAIGMYSTTLVFLFPILATPLTLYLLRYGIKPKKSLLIHLIIVVAITLLTGNIFEAILYLVAIVVPSQLFESLYRRHIPVPYIVMYVGIGTITAFYLYILGMQYVGIDYIQYYMTALDEYKMLQIQLVEEIMQMMPELQGESSFITFKEFINAQVLILKTIYPAMFLLIGIFLGIVHMVIVTVIGRLKKWRMQSLKQMAQFTFSKKMGILFIVAILLAQLTVRENEQLLMLGMNLFFFISSLLEVLGFIVLLVLIRRKKWNAGLKLASSLGIIILMMTFPSAFMIVGLSDTLFNFRKTKIII